MNPFILNLKGAIWGPPVIFLIEYWLTLSGVIDGLHNGKSSLEVFFDVNPLFGFILMFMGVVGLIECPKACLQYYLFSEPEQTDSDKDK